MLWTITTLDGEIKIHLFRVVFGVAVVIVNSVILVNVFID